MVFHVSDNKMKREEVKTILVMKKACYFLMAINYRTQGQPIFLNDDIILLMHV